MPLESDHASESSGVPGPGMAEREQAAIVRRLLKCAQTTTDKLASPAGSRFDGMIRSRLRSLGRCLHATDVHLYRIRTDANGSGPVALRYHSGRTARRPELDVAKRFQFQLFSSAVQSALMNDDIVQFSSGQSGAGRLLQNLLERSAGVSYLLCPLRQNGALRGAIGVSLSVPFETPSPEAIALLKLNGTLLLNHASCRRRNRRHSRNTKQWKSIADHACDFALVLNRQLSITRTIPYGLGSETPQLNGLRLKDVVVEEFHDRMESELAKAVESQNVRTFDFLLAIDHRGPCWFRARIAPSVSSASRLATIYLTDNNSDKLHEKHVRELKDKLIKANRLGLLGHMSTEFAHQLNQPLQAMLTYCNLLQRRLEKGTDTRENMNDGLGKIEGSILHSGKIIERIRDFVKYRTLRTEPVDVTYLIEQTLMLVTPSVQSFGGEVTADIEEIDGSVDVDPTQTVHVLVNLTINALEACRIHGKHRPQLQLSVREDAASGRLTIDVSDNGPGLPPDNPEIVFKKFYTDKTDGIGLGLAISRDVCQAQGGRLYAKNHCGKPGCTFSVEMRSVTENGNDTTELEVLSAGSIPAD